MSFSEKKIKFTKHTLYYQIALPESLKWTLNVFWDVQDELSGIYEYSFQFSFSTSDI